MEDFVETKSDLTLLSIILDKGIMQNPHRSIWFTELQKMKVRLELDSLGTGIISIPPSLGVLHLMAEDLDQTAYQILQSRIEPFLKQFPQQVLLVEGLNRFGAKKHHTIQELILQLVLNYHIGIIPTRNVDDTLACIIGLAKREQLHDKLPQLHRVKPKTQNVHDSQATFVEGLIQCGPTKTETLMNEFEGPMMLLDAIINNESKLNQIAGFGPQFLLRNRDLLNKILPKKSLNPSEPKN